MKFRPRFTPSDRTALFDRCFRGFRHASGGSSAVEFAFIAPIAIAMLIGVVDFGAGFYLQMEAQQAAQAGAQYAVVNGFIPNAPATDPRSPNAVANVVINATLFKTVTANPLPNSTCGCASASGIVTTTCTGTCSDGTAPGVYLNVSATGTYTTLLPYPFISNSFPLNGTATVRLQ